MTFVLRRISLPRWEDDEVVPHLCQLLLESVADVEAFSLSMGSLSAVIEPLCNGE